LAKPGQYSNKKPNEMSKNALLFFKYGIAKLYHIFPIVRVFQITRKLVQNGVFVKISVTFKLKNLMKTVEFRPLVIHSYSRKSNNWVAF
jgi:hypothetical protein